MLHDEKGAKSGMPALKEFQGIVMAGYGSRLFPLTDSPALPKALLPIANRPMLYYPLQWLESAGITDIIVVCLREAAARINNYLNKFYENSAQSHIRLEVVDEGVGTAEALRALRPLILRDFVVLSCDTILDVPPRIALDTFRALDPTACVLFHGPGPDEKDASRDAGPEYVGIDSARSQLVYLNNRSDAGDDTLSLRMSLLRRWPVVTLHTALQDAHVYIFQRWVLDVLERREGLSSIRADLLPYLLQLQYRAGVVRRDGMQSLLDGHENALQRALALSTTGRGLYADSAVSVSAIVVRDQWHVARASTIAAYSEVNLKIASGGWPMLAGGLGVGHAGDAAGGPGGAAAVPPAGGGAAQAPAAQAGPAGGAGGAGADAAGAPGRVDPTAEISGRTRVGNDSIVGAYTKIGERCSVKRSVIGSHCVIGDQVKISNCVIMDHVVLEAGARLEGTVVCSNAKVGDHAILKDCEVGATFSVPRETKGKQEKYFSSAVSMLG